MLVARALYTDSPVGSRRVSCCLRSAFSVSRLHRRRAASAACGVRRASRRVARPTARCWRAPQPRRAWPASRPSVSCGAAACGGMLRFGIGAGVDRRRAAGDGIGARIVVGRVADSRQGASSADQRAMPRAARTCADRSLSCHVDRHDFAPAVVRDWTAFGRAMIICQENASGGPDRHHDQNSRFGQDGRRDRRRTSTSISSRTRSASRSTSPA